MNFIKKINRNSKTRIFDNTLYIENDGEKLNLKFTIYCEKDSRFDVGFIKEGIIGITPSLSGYKAYSPSAGDKRYFKTSINLNDSELFPDVIVNSSKYKFSIRGEKQEDGFVFDLNKAECLTSK